MLILRLIILGVLTAFPFKASALEKCDVINALERIQFAQMRLVDLSQIRANSPDVLLLGQHLFRLDSQGVKLATQQQLTPVQNQTLSAFIANARRLDTILKLRRFLDAKEYMRTQGFQRPLADIQKILPRFKCNDTNFDGNTGGNGAGQIDTGRSSQLSGFDLPQVAIWTFILISCAAGGLLASRKFIRLQREKDRRAKRYATHIKTTLRMHSIQHETTVVDLSCNGAKLQIKGGLDGTSQNDVSILLGDAWKKCEVTWKNQHFCGVRFEQRLSASALRKLLKQKPAVVYKHKKTAPAVDAVL